MSWRALTLSAMSTPVFRFAPSPNGYLHLGHALSALLNFDMARAAGGRLAAAHRGHRRDPLPAGIRSRRSMRTWPGSASAWEQPVRRQSEHFDDYRAALAELDALGLVYPSFESRAEIARLVAEREAHGALAARSRRRAALSGLGADRCRRPSARRAIAAGEPYALRLDMAAALARAGPLAWTETGAAGRRAPASSRRSRRPGATWCWRARKCRPATTCRSWSTTRCRA